MSLFPKQTANSLVTETLQYFVFFCRSDDYAILAKCLIINDLRLILVILFFIAFLNITYVARHTFGTLALSKGMPIESVSRVLGHTNIKTTQIYAKITTQKLGNDLTAFGNQLNRTFGNIKVAGV
ncbi:tyrosine-type recombinase/integrase [Parabacteroides distasonis]|uniref:Tyrosine-type recombinase/integrase n=1 Tax=Parabacteroides distasonis TaxID=823 RepID=A0AAW6F5D3_PARDI|nr:tyrosine-type recombinase/integrase [Parabacteroides distasonis]MDB9138427.1 tyrosine-type recombinase/integrase [Parabacteroides distasonis]MDB9142785.1 tyrosine-type recombinase/integrase [Parabacteroides distasonis]